MHTFSALFCLLITLSRRLFCQIRDRNVMLRCLIIFYRMIPVEISNPLIQATMSLTILISLQSHRRLKYSGMLTPHIYWYVFTDVSEDYNTFNFSSRTSEQPTLLGMLVPERRVTKTHRNLVSLSMNGRAQHSRKKDSLIMIFSLQFLSHSFFFTFRKAKCWVNGIFSCCFVFFANSCTYRYDKNFGIPWELDPGCYETMAALHFSYHDPSS